MDVFGNLNKYLEKGCEDSINYGPDDSSLIDLSTFDFENGNNDKSREKSKDPECLDLTINEDFSPPKRSRRAADSIVASEVIELKTLEESNSNKEAENQDLIDLSSNSASEPISRRTRRRLPKTASKAPNVPKAPKQKRLTYKQALAVATAQISDELLVTPPLAAPSPRSVRLSRRELNETQSNAIDLTGDVHMTENHCTAPLFQKQNAVTVANAESDDDDLDPDALNIKLKYKGKLQALAHRRHQRYFDLFKAFSEQENIPISDIFIYNGNKRIYHDDTPHSSGYTITTILTVRTMHMKSEETFQHVRKKDQIELKFQSDKWKKPVIVKISKLDNFEIILAILCETVNFKPDQISLSFDGDSVSLKDTPFELEFEGGEILDCRVKL